MALEDPTPATPADAGGYPRHADGSIDLARAAATLSLELHPVGTAIIACATYLALLDEITPRRGEQRDLLDQFASSLHRIHETYCDVDERLVELAMRLDIESQCA